MKIFKYLYFSVFFTLIFISCKDNNEYKVNSEFAPYLQRFIDEGAKRGKTFDLKGDGLIIEFGDLDNNIAGLTHYEDPVRIQIDRTYWNTISKYNGADMMKEDLMFHELGHGLLNRKHLNTFLENGDWKTIMCGGDKVDDHPWNINYRGIRRKYYLDELFNESTGAPSYASMKLPVDTAIYKIRHYISFDTEAQAGWRITDSTAFKTSIDNGRLKFESRTNAIYLLFAKVSVDVSSDFSYQLTISYPQGDNSDNYGILFGNFTNTNDSVEYFTVNNSKKMRFGNRSWYTFFSELPENQIIANGNNTLKICKIGTFIYYFINNTYCYMSEIEVKTGKFFGFMVPANGTVYLDNLYICDKKAGSQIGKRAPSTMEFGFKRIDNRHEKKLFNSSILF